MSAGRTEYDGSFEYHSRLGWIPRKIRNHLVALLGEFVGTFFFLFMAFAATQVANTTVSTPESEETMALPSAPNVQVLLFISLAFGFSLAVNAWVFFRVSGGLFNPAVTFALCLVGAISWVRGAVVLIGQVLGAIAASAVVSGILPGPLGVRTRLSPETSQARGVFLEMFLTAQLILMILMLAVEKHKATFLAPVGIGLALFIAELAGVQFTGGSLNPARSFGPDVVLGTFDSYHWIYWIGPFLGALIAVLFYRIIKILEYETANPGQDFNEKEVQAQEFQTDGTAESISQGPRSDIHNSPAITAPGTATQADERAWAHGGNAELGQGIRR